MSIDRYVLRAVAVDSLMTLIAVTAAGLIRLRPDNWNHLADIDGVLRVILLTGLMEVCFVGAGVYAKRTRLDRRAGVSRTLVALAFASFILAVVYWWQPGLMIGRGVFSIAALLAGLLVWVASLLPFQRTAMPDATTALR